MKLIPGSGLFYSVVSREVHSQCSWGPVVLEAVFKIVFIQGPSCLNSLKKWGAKCVRQCVKMDPCYCRQFILKTHSIKIQVVPLSFSRSKTKRKIKQKQKIRLSGSRLRRPYKSALIAALVFYCGCPNRGGKHRNRWILSSIVAPSRLLRRSSIAAPQ